MSRSVGNYKSTTRCARVCVIETIQTITQCAWVVRDRDNTTAWCAWVVRDRDNTTTPCAWVVRDRDNTTAPCAWVVRDRDNSNYNPVCLGCA